MSFIIWHSTIAKKPCYEALEEIERHSYIMPFEWIDGKKVFPYGYSWTLEKMARWRKDAIIREERSWFGNYKEPCNNCQIKSKCDAGFPKNEKTGIIAKLKNLIFKQTHNW